MIQAIAFYLFAGIVLLSGTLVISARNPVHAVLWLILAFFNAAGLMILCGAEFIAMLLVIVYVGAVAVLFLFVVMMLNIDFAEMRSGFVRYLPIGLLVALVMAAETIMAIGAWKAGGVELSRRAGPVDPTLSNIEAVGQLLYSRYLFVFEGAGLVLLVAMIGAIVLTHRQRSGLRPQNIASQVKRRPWEATRNLKPEVGKGVEL